MKNKLVLTLMGGIVLLVFPSCGPNLVPQESCNFVKSSNKQRVSWKKDIPVHLFIHESVPEEYYSEIERSVADWNDTVGKELLRIVGWGITEPAAPARDNLSVIYWMEEWEDDRKNEQGRTTIYWSANKIYEADIRVNADDFEYFIDRDTDNPRATVDKIHFASLMKHELGHVLGLNHVPTQQSQMFSTLNKNNDERAGKIFPTDVNSLSCEY